MDLGSTITEIRKLRKIKQSDLAAKCNITQAYLSSIENNKKEPVISKLKEIANALDVPLPVVFFLSMDEADISNDKKQLFEFLFENFKPILYNNFVKESEVV